MKTFPQVFIALTIFLLSYTALAKDENIFAPVSAGPRKVDVVDQSTAPNGIRKWEYLFVPRVGKYTKDGKDINFYLQINRKLWRFDLALDYLGNLGWELVTTSDGNNDSAYIFKREVPKN